MSRAATLFQSRPGAPRRGLAVCAVLAALTALGTLAALMLGDFQVGAGDLVAVATGHERGPLRMVVLEWRLPRALMAVLLGAALGLSGAIFQSLTRNPLGSPDVIGLNAGSWSGALIVMILFSGGAWQVAGGAVVGGLATAACVYLLAWRDGAQGFRLIVVGIGIGAMLTAFNTWLMLRASLEVAMSAAVWGTGSLNGIGAGSLIPAGLIVLGVLVPALAALAPAMRQLEMGDDLARALGVPVEPARLALLAAGVGLTAVATAAAGPIAFVALAAPQIGRRLARGGAGAALWPAALTGALLLSVSDLLAAHAFAPRQMPVGVVTLTLGGIYLLWLIRREAGRS